MHKEKPSNFFTKIAVQKQLYMIYFIAILLPVIAIGSYLVYNTRAMLKEHYEKQSYSDNLRVKSLLLDLTSSLYNKACSLTSDKQLIQLLSGEYATPLEGALALESYDGFQDLLSHDASIEEISVYTLNTTLPEGQFIHQITEETKKERWFGKASASVTPFWAMEPWQDSFGNESLALCLHARIFLPRIQSYAILNLTVSNNHVKNRIETGAMHTVIWLDGNGVVYSSGKEDIHGGLLPYAPGKSGYYLGTVSVGEEKMVGCIAPLLASYSGDLFYIASLNFGAFPYMNHITFLHCAILLTILAATSLFIFLFSSYFSKRIITLRETMHNASLGNYDIADTFPGEDEISQVFADLNVMVQDILRKEAEAYEARIRTQELVNRQQKMEFKMLTSQINPHFLYNTLETIRMRSLKAGNREVAEAVKLLGKSMRYVLENTSTSFTTLEKELDYIKTYLAIQRLRFHDRVNYSVRIPPQMDVSRYQILPLLLQPIVENAILHGLEEVEQGGHIIIHIRQKEKYLYIDIFDNGCGMTLEEQCTMYQNIYFHPKESSKSIGLSNIFQRIQLCYGKEYGLQVKSKKQAGTLFTVILPAQKYEGGATQ